MYCILHIPTGIILCHGAPGTTIHLFSSRQCAKKHLRHLIRTSGMNIKRVEFEIIKAPSNV